MQHLNMVIKFSYREHGDPIDRRKYLKQWEFGSIGANAAKVLAEMGSQKVSQIACASIDIYKYGCTDQRTLTMFIDLFTDNLTSTGFIIGPKLLHMIIQ